MVEKEDMIKAMRNVLNGIEPTVQAILFGSRARGDAEEDIDWDVLVLIDNPHVSLSDYDKYSYPLRELGWDMDEIINPVSFSTKEWNENHFTIFNHNVGNEGIAI